MKTTYILLRDNKESGPYSEETLKTMGLKPDDLVWVEGQSVYWLRPSEIKELQTFISDKPQAIPSVTIPDSSWEKYTPGASEKKEPAPAIKPIIIPEKIEEPIIIKPKKQRSKTVTLIFRPATQNVALYAGLLVAGIAAGIIISKKSDKAPDSIANNSVTNPVSKPLSQVLTTDTITSLSGNITDTIAKADPQQTVQSTVLTEQNNPQKNLAKNSTAPEIKDSPDTAKDHIQPAVEKTEDPLPIKENKPTRSELSSQVSVKANDYVVAAFGGIRDLELTVRNNSKYDLEKVIVELTYLKPRDEFLRSENISFKDVPAEGKLTIPVKKSNRGVKVTYKVVKIEAKEMGL